MNKFAFYAGYHNGKLTKKILEGLPLDKSASEFKYLTPAEFSTMVEKTAGWEDFTKGLGTAWNDFSNEYSKNPNFAKGVNTVGGALIGGTAGGVASKMAGKGFWPGALIGGAGGGFVGNQYGGDIVNWTKGQYGKMFPGAETPNNTKSLDNMQGSNALGTPHPEDAPNTGGAQGPRFNPATGHGTPPPAVAPAPVAPPPPAGPAGFTPRAKPGVTLPTADMVSSQLTGPELDKYNQLFRQSEVSIRNALGGMHGQELNPDQINQAREQALKAMGYGDQFSSMFKQNAETPFVPLKPSNAINPVSGMQNNEKIKAAADLAKSGAKPQYPAQNSGTPVGSFPANTVQNTLNELAPKPAMQKVNAQSIGKFGSENPWIRPRSAFKYMQGRDKVAAMMPIPPPQAPPPPAAQPASPQQSPISAQPGATPLSEPAHNGPYMRAKAGFPIVKAQGDKETKEAEAHQAAADAKAASFKVNTETRKAAAKKKITDAKLALKAIEPVKPQGPGQMMPGPNGQPQPAAPGQMPGSPAMIQ
jgi:hypothetical protein